MKKVMYIIMFILSMFILSTSVYAWSEYKIGDIVPYNDMEFYVIKNSGSNEESVILLKKEPLSVSDVNTYGVGHVNRYVYFSIGTALDLNGYGGMAYYSSTACGLNGIDNCTNAYEQSEVKYVVDAWKIAKAPAASEARLITIDDLTDNLGYVLDTSATSELYIPSGMTPSWVYNSDYWTMSPYQDSSSRVLVVRNDGGISDNVVYSNEGVVRPVITILKSALGDIDDNKQDEVIPDKQEDKTSETSTKVRVANTYMSTSIIILISGFILACISIVIYYIIKKKKGV